MKSCDIGTSTVVLHKNLITQNIKFASLATKEDFVLWLRILKNNVSIYGLNEDLTFWTKSKNSLDLLRIIYAEAKPFLDEIIEILRYEKRTKKNGLLNNFGK